MSSTIVVNADHFVLSNFSYPGNGVIWTGYIKIEIRQVTPIMNPYAFPVMGISFNL
jgi:hypothetical protein